MTNWNIPATMFRVTNPEAPAPATRLARLSDFARRHVTPARAFIAAAGIYLLLSAISFFIVAPTTQLYFADYWEHRAILNEIVRGGTHLLDPIYGEAASSRQFTPWSLALGYLARTGMGVDMAMACGAMLVSLLFVGGVHAFARAYYGHRWAPPVLLTVLTCGWGLPPLIWTGFYAFRSQLHGNYYPAALVFALSFVAWASTLHLLKRFNPFNALLLGAVVAISVVTHPLNAAFLIAGAGAFIVLEPQIPAARRIATAAVIATGIFATIFWPYFNPLSLAGAGLVRGQATFNNFGFFFDPLFVIAMAWPGIFALLGLPGFLRDRSLHMPLVALGCTFSAYVIGGIADVSVSHRLLAYVILWLHLLLVKAALDVIYGHPPRMMDKLTPRAWRWLYAGAAILAAWHVGLAAQQLTDPWAETHYPYPVRNVEAETSQVVATLPRGSRILGWDSAALVMPSHGVLVAAFPRPMPLSPSDSARQTDYRRFFAPGTPNCERVAIARRWQVTHVAWLINELDDRVQRELTGLGTPATPSSLWRIIPVPAQTKCAAL